MVATIFDGDLTDDVTAAIRNQPSVAIDTETSGLNWRADRLQLVQLCTEATGAVLIRIDDRTPQRLITVLTDESVQKVFHFAPFDLRFMAAAWGVRVRSVACTKTASKLADPDLPPGDHSLRPLLERELGFRIEKGAVRTSDWGATELTSAQIDYAMADVAHLLPLHEKLEQRLSATDRLELYRAVCRFLPVDAVLRVQGVPDPLQY